MIEIVTTIKIGYHVHDCGLSSDHDCVHYYDACDERGNFEGCRYACFLSVADVGTILPVVMKPRKPR